MSDVEKDYSWVVGVEPVCRLRWRGEIADGRSWHTIFGDYLVGSVHIEPDLGTALFSDLVLTKRGDRGWRRVIASSHQEDLGGTALQEVLHDTDYLTATIGRAVIAEGQKRNAFFYY